ncbi:amino acid racemase [Candidatus Bathyarchaeota archaeon]|nr:amino acid racemase [Candidatus Bathyarchaeota archaeon]MBS7630044.1 amino acid racemase [Candidatus Bathyarchaeota archaeon]
MLAKIIGILGGMGPEATAELFLRIIRATPAEKDQDHLRIIIDNNPQIPDRTTAIMNMGPSPLPELISTGLNLERAGVDFIIIPCNTAHYYYDSLIKELHVPVLNMLRLTAEKVSRLYPGADNLGLLATDGTIMSGIYSMEMKKFGLNILAPAGKAQKKVMEAIYRHIKIGNLAEGRRIILNIGEKLIDEGADLLICGCTEVSLVLKEGDLQRPVIDPLQILAETAVEMARRPD